MELSALNILLNGAIAAISAVASAYVLIRRQHAEDRKSATSEHEALTGGLYREINRLTAANDTLRKENLEQQTKILDLSRVVLDLQNKINLLELRLSQYIDDQK